MPSKDHKRFARGGWGVLRRLVVASAVVAGVSIFLMITVTCLDVILRRFGASVPGAYDIVRLLGGVTIATSLPLTTAVKGHVAIEYFFHRLNHRGRAVVDTMMRSLQVLFFLAVTWSFLVKGHTLLRDGEVTPTLQCPVFWLAWLIALMALLTAVVSFFHLIRPGKELVRS